MSKTIVHPTLGLNSFKPLVCLSQEQISALISTETNRQAYEKLDEKRNQFKVRTTVDFRIAYEKAPCELSDLIAKDGTETDGVTVTVSTTVVHCNLSNTNFVLDQVYKSTFNKQTLVQFIKENFSTPVGFFVADVVLVVSCKNFKGSTLQANITLSLKD